MLPRWWAIDAVQLESVWRKDLVGLSEVFDLGPGREESMKIEQFQECERRVKIPILRAWK